MAAAYDPEVGCSIIGVCFDPQIKGGCHKCRGCQAPVHNLCLQEVSGVEDKMPFYCGVRDCMENMGQEAREDVLRVYSERKEKEAEDAGDSESFEDSNSDGDEAEVTASTKCKSFRCGAGSACMEPVNTAISSLCKHGKPRHFECDQLPCKDGCGDVAETGGSDDGEEAQAAGMLVGVLI